jgi:hypothetical protein
MITLTQANRQLNLETPLGEDVLLLMFQKRGQPVISVDACNDCSRRR